MRVVLVRRATMDHDSRPTQSKIPSIEARGDTYQRWFYAGTIRLKCGGISYMCRGASERRSTV